jgi:hypothetical protein
MKYVYRSTLPLMILMILFTPFSSVMAQSADGEFCVRAFEDLNGNGVRDLNEPPLQRAVSANLLDANNIVVASALLDNSPQMARGLICFQFLSPGQYTIEVTSAEFTPTTSRSMTNVVRSGEVPFVMEFGAARPGVSAGAAVQGESPEVSVEQALPRIAVSLAGAAAAFLVMLIVGFLIYLVVYRPRLKRAMTTPSDDYYRRPPTTGSIPRVTDTGEFRKK